MTKRHTGIEIDALIFTFRITFWKQLVVLDPGGTGWGILPVKPER